MNKLPTLLCSALLMSALPVCALHAAQDMATDTQSRLEQQIGQLQQQLDAMKAELKQLREAQAGTAQGTAANPAASRTTAATPATSTVASATTSATVDSAGISPNLNLWGYGEVYYLHPRDEGTRTVADLARAVFGIGYRFNDRTSFNSEFEVEHAISSADDAGEFEVEQFYVDHELTDWASVKAGLFLMPFGLLNEHHEPTRFYGVQRNFVETLIIPSTWREGGVGLHGNTLAGLSWDVGLTTGLNLGGWNPNPSEPLFRTAYDLINGDAGPMRATHQELQLANAQNLSQYVSLNYNGVPGLLAGAAVFTGKAAKPTFPAGLPDQRATLWEGHVRWMPGAADLSAVYAQGRFSNTAAFNLANAGGSNPMPSRFEGYFLQAAYTVWQRDGYRLSPFARWEYFDLGAGYEGIAPGFTPVPEGNAVDGKPWPQMHDRIWTVGASLYLHPQVVLKIDYQHFNVNRDLTRFDVGLGLSF